MEAPRDCRWHSPGARADSGRPSSASGSGGGRRGPARGPHGGGVDAQLRVDVLQLLRRVLAAPVVRFLSNFFAKFCNFSAGSFSAVSKRNFARKYACDSMFQARQDLHTFAPLQSQNFRKKLV